MVDENVPSKLSKMAEENPKTADSVTELGINQSSMSVKKKFADIVLIKKNKRDAKSFPLNKNSIIIGRDEDCDIRILLETVSSKHVQISVGDNYKITATNLSNTNRPYLNKMLMLPMEKTTLHDGDYITIADRKFRIEIPLLLTRNTPKSTRKIGDSSGKFDRTRPLSSSPVQIPPNVAPTLQSKTFRSVALFRPQHNPFKSPKLTTFPTAFSPKIPTTSRSNVVDLLDQTPGRNGRLSPPLIAVSRGIEERENDNNEMHMNMFDWQELMHKPSDEVVDQEKVNINGEQVDSNENAEDFDEQVRVDIVQVYSENDINIDELNPEDFTNEMRMKNEMNIDLNAIDSEQMDDLTGVSDSWTNMDENRDGISARRDSEFFSTIEPNTTCSFGRTHSDYKSTSNQSEHAGNITTSCETKITGKQSIVDCESLQMNREITMTCRTSEIFDNSQQLMTTSNLLLEVDEENKFLQSCTLSQENEKNATTSMPSTKSPEHEATFHEHATCSKNCQLSPENDTSSPKQTLAFQKMKLTSHLHCTTSSSHSMTCLQHNINSSDFNVTTHDCSPPKNPPTPKSAMCNGESTSQKSDKKVDFTPKPNIKLIPRIGTVSIREMDALECRNKEKTKNMKELRGNGRLKTDRKKRKTKNVEASNRILRLRTNILFEQKISAKDAKVSQQKSIVRQRKSVDAAKKTLTLKTLRAIKENEVDAEAKQGRNMISMEKKMASNTTRRNKTEPEESYSKRITRSMTKKMQGYQEAIEQKSPPKRTKNDKNMAINTTKLATSKKNKNLCEKSERENHGECMNEPILRIKKKKTENIENTRRTVQKS